MTTTETDPTDSSSRCRRQLLQSTVGLGVGTLLTPVWVTGAEETQSTEDPLQWRFDTDGGTRSSPTVVDGTVYVGSGDNSLYALDALEGTKQWEFETGHTIDSSPAVVDGLVVVGNYDGFVFGVNADDGSKRWEFNPGERGFGSSATIVEETAYIVSWNGNVYAVDVTDGSERWSYTEGGAASSPVVVGGTVFAGVGYDIVALDATDGTELWSFEAKDTITASPTVANGLVYVGDSYGRKGHLYALKAATGEFEWVYDRASLHDAPTVADGTVYFGSGSGLYALDATDGSEEWVSYTHNFYRSSPTVVDGAVYAGTGISKLCAFDTSDGSKDCLLGEGEIVSFRSPTIVDGTAYITDSDGRVSAIDIPAAGSSYDSRVRLGTLGHHDDWQGQMRSLNFDPGRDDELQIDQGANRPDDSENGEENATDEGDDTDGDDMPGLGIGSSLAALGGAGYLLRRRLGGDEATE